MEIEKKFTIKKMPENLECYEKKVIEQGYLCVSPVLRIRRSNEDYIFTYKSARGIKNEPDASICKCHEVEADLDRESYQHLKSKIDGNVVSKIRYIIPLENGQKAELDVFQDQLEGLVFAEVEFKDETEARAFVPPDWFDKDVSSDKRYQNKYLATLTKWHP